MKNLIIVLLTLILAVNFSNAQGCNEYIRILHYEDDDTYFVASKDIVTISTQYGEVGFVVMKMLGDQHTSFMFNLPEQLQCVKENAPVTITFVDDSKVTLYNVKERCDNFIVAFVDDNSVYRLRNKKIKSVELETVNGNVTLFLTSSQADLIMNATWCITVNKF